MKETKKKKFEWIKLYAFYGDCELGYIELYPKWNKWVWNQGEDIVMSISCLKNVVKRLEELENDKRN